MTIMVLEIDSYGVREQKLLCQRVTVVVYESKVYGVDTARDESLHGGIIHRHRD
jgi:hypothetical protein